MMSLDIFSGKTPIIVWGTFLRPNRQFIIIFFAFIFLGAGGSQSGLFIFCSLWQCQRPDEKKGKKGSKKVPHGALGRGGWGAGSKAIWTMAIFNPIDLSGLLEHIQI